MRGTGWWPGARSRVAPELALERQPAVVAGGAQGAQRLAAELSATEVLDPDADPPLGVRIRELNGGSGADVAIELSGSDRALQGALASVGLGATVVAVGFYQGGAASLRLGEEFHHNRLTLVGSMGAWGAPHRHAPLWHRGRVMATITRLLYSDRVSVQGLLDRRFEFADAPAAYRWIDAHPQAAVKVALTY